MDHFDPYNTNIPVLLMTAFVLQGHILFQVMKMFWLAVSSSEFWSGFIVFCRFSRSWVFSWPSPAGFVAIFTFEPHVKLFVMQNSWTYWVGYMVFLVPYLVIMCCGDFRRKHPWNLISLVNLWFGVVNIKTDLKGWLIAISLF